MTTRFMLGLSLGTILWLCVRIGRLNERVNHLMRLACERDAEVLEAKPYTEEELSFAKAEDWGPAEDWSDWGSTDGEPRG